jgi:hypothetical protein
MEQRGDAIAEELFFRPMVEIGHSLASHEHRHTRHLGKDLLQSKAQRASFRQALGSFFSSLHGTNSEVEKKSTFAKIAY